MNSSQSYGKQKVRFNHSKKVCAQEEISFGCLHFLYSGYFSNHREIEVLIDWSRKTQIQGETPIATWQRTFSRALS